MEMNGAREPSASWSEGESQKWTGTGQLATYVGTTQGLGGVFDIAKMDWNQGCEMTGTAVQRERHEHS